ncbi:UPF0061 protein [Nymphon striatum]|nr:UPF0061 protein [Nymphon striatum]
MELGLSGLSSDGMDEVEIFSGNKILEGSEPIAMAYAGHQFGGFSPQLGDGRAIQLGEILSPDGVRYDIQLKGSGPTPWSRGGDGRSALGPVIREYLLSEAMAKLGVPTTRALAAVTTGEQVARNTLVPGGIITRVATGFVRVGTFEYFHRRGNEAAVKQLADYEIERHYSLSKEAENPYIAFFTEVVERQIRLIAQWMQIGFIHGVMNTDNMSIAGETIDYGPCAFMDEFDNNRVYSSIDRDGRYAYNNQPKIGQWNLVRLAETLLPLFHEDQDKSVEMAQDILNGYGDAYQKCWLEGMRKKLGLLEEQDGDAALVGELLAMMNDGKADFTLTFYCLSELVTKFDDVEQLKKIHDLFSNQEFTKSVDKLNTWLPKWKDRLVKESLSNAELQVIMHGVNPVYIPRNHQVEAAIRAAEDHNDFSDFHDLHEVLQNPYELQSGKDSYLLPPEPEEVSDWQSLVEGDSLIVKDDAELLIGASSVPNTVLPNSLLQGSDFSFTNASELKRQVLDNADSILDNYYRTHPLSLIGFNQQVEGLLNKHGATEFCAPFGKTSNQTLFVDGGEVVAESSESPRHPYGVFFEMDKPMSAEAMQNAAYKWLSSGEAYDRYIGMNVCRYNC